MGIIPDMTDWLDYTILALGILFLVVGAALLFTALRGNQNGSPYAVGQMAARRAARRMLANGLGLIGLGVLLMGLWYLFTRPPDPAIVAASATATAAALPTPVPPTATLPPTFTPSPEIPTSTPSPIPSATPTPTATLPPTATPTPLALAGSRAQVNSVDGLNLRSAPGGEIVVMLDDGTEVTLLDGYDTSGQFFWRQVALDDGAQGWVAESFLVFLTPTPDP
jgi:hypothetical protein